ncbi:MAG: T9SS type A sorting domain-containing protein, partial [Bacteroidia bacterium]|nr:T9SS type A sorting domain-containing protein [Bacteroidia bacterium]
NGSGNIYKVSDTACAPTAYINSRDTIINCTGGPITLNAIYGTGLTYQWYMNSTLMGGSNASFTLPFVINNSTIFVTVMNLNCTATSNTILVLTDASFTTLDSLYCINAPVVPLIGSPSGGTFNGPGITGNLFDPNAAGSGTHIITYTYSDNVSTCNHLASGCVLVDSQTVVVDLCVGIEEQNNIHGVNIYPNPNHSEFKVEFTLLRNSDVVMTATDALGRMVYENKVEGKRGKQKITINFSSNVEGVYFLFMKTKSDIIVSKVIVQN